MSHGDQLWLASQPVEPSVDNAIAAIWRPHLQELVADTVFGQMLPKIGDTERARLAEQEVRDNAIVEGFIERLKGLMNECGVDIDGDMEGGVWILHGRGVKELR